MAHGSRISVIVWSVVILAVSLSFVDHVGADPVVWTGPTISFSKLGSADPTLPQNQDRLTGNVWITRGGSGEGGIFNIAPDEETAYVRFSSPADTEWATEVMTANVGQTISASNWEQLTFTAWAEAYGGPGFGLGENILAENAVVHLITDDIYLDLTFTQFDSSGLVAYQRSTAPPTGDYNRDGVVDAGDYVVWRKTLNQSAEPNGSGADGNANGMIDAGDYSYWTARFGNVVPGLGGSITVPEPATLALLMFATAGWCLRPRRYES